MDPYTCAAALVIAGLATGPLDEPVAVVNEPLEVAAAPAIAAPTASVTVLDQAPVSFRFLTREEGHEILLTDVHVAIRHPVNGTLYDAVSTGPYFLAFVPVGRYEVAASHDGRTRRMTLTVARAEPRSVALYW